MTAPSLLSASSPREKLAQRLVTVRVRVWSNFNLAKNGAIQAEGLIPHGIPGDLVRFCFLAVPLNSAVKCNPVKVLRCF